MVTRHSSSQSSCNASADGGDIGPLPSEAGVVDDTIAFSALERSLGKEAALEILSSFVGFTAASAVELRTLIEQNDRKKARALLHELIHSCKVIGATPLLRSCNQLQAQLENADTVQFNVALSELGTQSKAIARRLRQLLS